MPAAAATSRAEEKSGSTAATSGGKGPSYAVRVAAALAQLRSRTGASLPAITGYISSNYGPVNKTALASALRKGVEDETLVKVRASYKLNAKKHPPAKKPVARKKPEEVVTTSASTGTLKSRKAAAKKAMSASAAAARKPKKAIAKKKTAAPTKAKKAAASKKKTTDAKPKSKAKQKSKTKK